MSDFSLPPLAPASAALPRWAAPLALVIGGALQCLLLLA
jgi:hypothetical protein